MRISLDLDNTLAQTMESTVHLYNQRFSTSYTIDDVTDWNWWNVFFPISSQHNAKNTGYRLMDEAWLIGGIEPIPKFERVLELVGDDDLIDIVTGRETTPVPVLLDWLKRHRIPYDNFIVSTDKEDLDYDVYIDDDPRLAEKIKDRRGKVLILFDQPWNRHISSSRNVVRVFSWDDVVQQVKFLKGPGRMLFRRPEKRVPLRTVRVGRYSRRN